ncbi:MAG: RNA-binding protein [Nitratireductor sp.]
MIGNAVKVMRIATGEDEDETPDDGKDAAAKKLGAKSGKKRAANLSSERRAEIARNAAAKRWGKAD